jgi:hypothetical protein
MRRGRRPIFSTEDTTETGGKECGEEKSPSLQGTSRPIDT